MTKTIYLETLKSVMGRSILHNLCMLNLTLRLQTLRTQEKHLEKRENVYN